MECLVDTSVPRAFPTYPEYMEECDRTGEQKFLPGGCYTTYRDPDGRLVAVVDEEKHQQHQLREAEEKAANASKPTDASLKDDVFGKYEDKS